MFEPKNRIHWIAALIIAVILILILGVATARGQEAGESAAAPAVTPPQPGPCGVSPAYMARDREPRIANGEEVRREMLRLQAEEPVGGGRAILWLCVVPTGHVYGIRVRMSSGDPAVDSHAIRVAAMIRFEPAKLRGEPVVVWVALPIEFVPQPVEL